MKSLRTDDIIGASPTVRHMPKNIIRQQKYYPYNSQGSFNNQREVDNYYKSLGGKWDHSYNTNIYQNFPLSQYDPNPFVKPIPFRRNDQQQIIYPPQKLYTTENILERTSRYKQLAKKSNYPPSNKNQNEKPYRQSSYQKYNQNMLASSGIMKKQSPLINYQQVRQYERLNNHLRNTSNELENMKNSSQMNNPQSKRLDYQLSQSMKMSNLNESQNLQYSQNLQNLNNSQNSIIMQQSNKQSEQKQKQSKQGVTPRESRLRSSSSLNTQQSDKNQKNIFRGLGFNIITNSKYQFNLQTRDPYTKRNYD